MRILQISDTHISAVHPHFMANVSAIWQAVAETGADLVINTGDLSMNGAIRPEDLQQAAEWHHRLPLPWLAVPGNHDVGDIRSIRPDQEVDDTRLARFRSAIGPDRWTHDRDGWRLIGLNSMLFGTGHPEEAAQLAWLAEAVAFDGPIAVFLHKPLFIDQPDEGPRGYWTVIPPVRRQLLEVFAGRDIRLIASGHLHIARSLSLDGISHVWSPASSFVVGDRQEDLGGIRQIGMVLHEFSAEAVSSQWLWPEGVISAPLDPVHDEIYPPLSPATA